MVPLLLSFFTSYLVLDSFVLLDKKAFTGLTLLTVIQFVIFESYKLRFRSWFLNAINCGSHNMMYDYHLKVAFNLFLLSQCRLFKNSFKFILLWSLIKFLIGLLFHRIIGIIVKEIESNISKNTFLVNFRMGSLPTLCKKFVELVGILVSHKRKKY